MQQQQQLTSFLTQQWEDFQLSEVEICNCQHPSCGDLRRDTTTKVATITPRHLQDFSCSTFCQYNVDDVNRQCCYNKLCMEGWGGVITLKTLEKVPYFNIHSDGSISLPFSTEQRAHYRKIQRDCQYCKPIGSFDQPFEVEYSKEFLGPTGLLARTRCCEIHDSGHSLVRTSLELEVQVTTESIPKGDALGWFSPSSYRLWKLRQQQVLSGKNNMIRDAKPQTKILAQKKQLRLTETARKPVKAVKTKAVSVATQAVVAVVPERIVAVEKAVSLNRKQRRDLLRAQGKLPSTATVAVAPLEIVSEEQTRLSTSNDLVYASENAENCVEETAIVIPPIEVRKVKKVIFESRQAKIAATVREPRKKFSRAQEEITVLPVEETCSFSLAKEENVVPIMLPTSTFVADRQHVEIQRCPQEVVQVLQLEEKTESLASEEAVALSEVRYESSSHCDTVIESLVATDASCSVLCDTSPVPSLLVEEDSPRVSFSIGEVKVELATQADTDSFVGTSTEDSSVGALPAYELPTKMRKTPATATRSQYEVATGLLNASLEAVWTVVSAGADVLRQGCQRVAETLLSLLQKLGIVAGVEDKGMITLWLHSYLLGHNTAARFSLFSAWYAERGETPKWSDFSVVVKLLMALDTLYGVLSSSTAAFVNKLAGNSTLTLTCQGEGDFWAPVLRGFESLEHLLRDLLGPIIGIFPFTTNDVKELTRKCADFTKISNAFERIAKYVQLFYDWVMDLYQRYYVGFPADIQKWVTLVDDVQKVAPSGSGFVTIRQSMAKSRCLRRHLWNLKDVGIRYKKRLETAGKDSFLLRVVNERMAKLESVISANSGVFAGAEGKEKPVVICFYGRPNQGKTVLTNPLCEDLFKVLDLDEYIPSQDRYTLSKTSLFFDQYYGQKVMDIQDFMQIRDPERRIHEIETIMSCGDESVAPLNVAECSAKGSVFFRSEFLFVSSNMDPNQMQGLMANVMEFPEALLRRMDFIVEVTLDDTKIYRPSTSDQVPDTVGGFDRSAMTFNVTGGCAGAKSSLGWYEFVQLVSQYYYQTRLHSEMMAASGDDARLVAIRNQLEASRLKLEIARSPFSAKEGEEKVSLSTEGLFEAPACNWFTLLLLVFLFVPQKLGWLIPYLRRRLSSFVFETDATATIKEAVQGVVRETIAEFTPQLCTLSADAGRSFTLGALSTPPVLEATAYAQNWRIVLDKYTSDLAQWYARMKTMAAAAFTAFAVSVATVLGYRWWTASKPVSVNVQAEMYTKPEEIRARRNARTVKKRAKVYEAEKAADTYQSRAYAAYGIRQPPAFRGFEVQGGNDCNMSLAQQKAIANLGRIKTPRCATCALGLYERVIAVPLHVFLDPYTDAVSYVSPNNVRYDFSMEQLRDEEVMVSEDTHLVFLNLKRVCNTMPEFCNIRSWLTPHEDVIPSGEGAMVTKRLVGQVAVPQVINAVNLHEVTELLMKDYGDPSRKGQIARDFTGYFYILYNAPSKPGDCGAPLIERRSPQAVIVGLHVAGDDGMCAAAPLTRELFDLVSDGFGSNGLPIPLHSEGIFPYTIPVDANGVDACGVIPDEVPRPWFPRKSKLRPTIFQRFSAPTTKPAQLAPFSREGVRVSPSTIAFEKNCSPSLCFPSHEISSAISEIAAYYAIGTPSQRRGTVWTLEQTVFGDPEKKIASMPSTGGIGYPHCLSMKRNQLFTLEPPFISDLFRQEVLSLEAQLRTTNVPVLVVDTLKDEKRPIPKVEAGKTRVFNVFPLAVNALAKMYFGDFLDYINSQWRTHPVSVGVSTDPVDWHFLAERICNKSNFIAGDVSGWDRVVPFEVMMAWVRQANIFYNDTNSDIRWHLGQSVFQPYHLFGDALYRLNRGMSSGTYLTATFNSLAMATSLHIVGKRCGVNALGSMLIFGDDHVVAHDQDSFTQQDVKKFFNDHFIEYTSADKKDVVEDFTQLLELRFLKRAFVERNGLYHCPMDVPELIEQLMWYRDSSTTRTESQQSLYQRMFDHLQMELVQHSPTLYEAISADIAAFAADKDCKLLNVPFDDRYKQLFCRDKNLGLMRDEDMFNGSKIALAVQGDVCDEEAPVGATTVADTLEHQHEIGLASFQELSIPVMAADTSYAAPVMSEAFELPSGLFEMATRPKLIKELTFNTSDMTAAPILRLDVMAALLGNANFVSKLANAAFLRFDLEIELRVIATKFHYGQLLVAWRPYYLAGLGNYAVRTTSVLVQYFGQGGLKGDNYSAYDTVWTASQQASHNISVTANTVLNLKIPWNMPFEKVPTPYLGIARWHPGVLDIYQLTPIGPTDIDRAQLAIFANFSNIRGWGYANSAKNKILKMPNVELDLPTIPAEMHPGWTIAFQSESVIPAAATLTTEGGEENTNSQPSVLRRILGTALDIFRVASTILSPYGTILNWLGLSRPQEQVQVKSMFSVTPNIVSSIGIDNSMTWAYNAALRLPVDQSQGLNLLIEKMGATSTYLGCNVTTTSAQLDNTFLVDPRISKLLPQTSSVATAQKFALTPAGWVIVGKFGMFRSHARVSIRFSSSAFIACRFSISVGYNSTIRDDDDCISFYPTKLVDVQGDVTVDVEIPYQRSAPWIDAQDGGALAYVRIKQLTSIVSPEATETRPIYYTVFASFPGLQVCEPRVATDGFSAYARVTALGVQQQIIKPTLPVQGDCDPFPAQGKVGTSLEWGANDVPSSLLHLAKRASAIAPEDGAWSPHNPIFPTQVVYKKWLYLSVRHPTYYHLVAEVFRFSRASLTFLGKATSLTAIGGSWTSGWWFGSSSKKNWKYASTSWPVSTDSYSWVTLPYYSHAQYLPTPIAACRPINSGGGWYIASPFTATEYGPPLATQTYYAEGLTGFLGGADDVMYQTFIGVPLQWWTHVEDI